MHPEISLMLREFDHGDVGGVSGSVVGRPDGSSPRDRVSDRAVSTGDNTGLAGLALQPSPLAMVLLE